MPIIVILLLQPTDAQERKAKETILFIDRTCHNHIANLVGTRERPIRFNGNCPRRK